ncbi:hypothetical protein [Methylobacterium sp. Leaf106]|uniref:hypothetical protein n=1 Tax=Methylobacterium sp. Leaf106 TaxID=1736255 RepID=UPI000700CC0F|nr:hypothetical protein [Methylobacterium sp. Leaf106]KQP53078.1 hypothetical protein ASF34_01535 [Methylobacterium sp. Leaf106]
MGSDVLTISQIAILRELARLGDSGGLTGNLAPRLFGPVATSERVRRPCQAMAALGFVRRHPTNDQRWFIIEFGRSALSTTTKGVGHE